MVLKDWCHYFEILEKIDKTEKRIYLRLDTDKGIKDVWLPISEIDFFDNMVQVPEWLCGNMGLI